MEKQASAGPTSAFKSQGHAMVFRALLPLPPYLCPKMTYALPAIPGQEGEFEGPVKQRVRSKAPSFASLPGLNVGRVKISETISPKVPAESWGLQGVKRQQHLGIGHRGQGRNCP